MHNHWFYQRVMLIDHPLPHDQAHCLLYMTCRYTRRKRLLDITEYKPPSVYASLSSFTDKAQASLMILELHRLSLPFSIDHNRLVETSNSSIQLLLPSLGDEAVAVPHPPWIDDVVRHRPSACRYPLSLLIAGWWSKPCLPPPHLSGPSNLHHPSPPVGEAPEQCSSQPPEARLLHSLHHAESSGLLHPLTRWGM